MMEPFVLSNKISALIRYTNNFKRGGYRTLLISAFLIISCTNDHPLLQEPFVGSWTLQRVSYSGTEMVEWAGSRLTMEQVNEGGGNYRLTETAYDSIWNEHGTWRKLNPSILVFSDTVAADFAIDGHDLSIHMYLPWTAQQTCSGVCYPIVTGDWYFYFRRAP